MMTISLWCKNRWIYLERYHDIGFTMEWSETLPNILQMSAEQIFPLQYDLRHLVVGKEGP